MVATNIDAAKVHLNKARNRGLRQRILQLIIPVTAHIASVFGVGVLWFARSGSFNFDPKSFVDWSLLLFCAAITAAGIYLVSKALPSPTEFSLTRIELGELLAISRAAATTSVHIVAGDLTWLADDLDTLVDLKKTNPALNIHIHYQRSRVPTEEVGHIAALDAVAIKLHPYSDLMLTARFTVIDIENVVKRRAFVYEKPAAASPIDRADQIFLWRQFDSATPAVTSGLCSVIDLLMSAAILPIKIGILGINNVGKTTFAHLLENALSTDLKVALVPDRFHQTNNGTSVQGNFVILLKELMDTPPPGNPDVVIYDRTTLDNLLFLKLRSSDFAIYDQIVQSIVGIIKSFDLVIYMRRSSESGDTVTKYVTADDRRRVQTIYDDCMIGYNIACLQVISRNDDFKASLSTEALEVAKEVRQIHYNKRISPR